MSTIIRTRSPFFIRTPQVTGNDPSTGTPNIDLLNYFQAIVTIHGGTSGSTTICDDLYATFTFKKKPLPNETSVTFEISELVNDHIIQTYDGTPNNSALTQSIWVNVVTSARQSNGTIIGSATTTTYLAQEGFNKFKEGVNYTTEPIAMISNTYYEYHKRSRLNIPINKERVNSIAWKFNGSTITTVNFTDNGNQNQKIAYASVSTSTQQYDEALVTYDTSSTISYTLQEIEECKYPVQKITFLNRWGALQDLFFHKKSINSLEATRENFNRSIFKARSVSLEEGEGEGEDCQETVTFNSYSTTAHAKKVHNANGTESVVLNSGFVDERMNVYFEELMVSEYMWLTDDQNVIYPVCITDSSFTKKTSLNDRLINYTMNFEKAFDFVNNIR